MQRDHDCGRTRQQLFRQMVRKRGHHHLRRPVHRCGHQRQRHRHSYKHPDATLSGSANITVQLVTPRSTHIVLVMEENQGYSTVVGNTTSWAHLNALIAAGALPTNYYADAHFSIPNYFMLTTGQILTTDDNSTTVWNVDNIARRMLAAGISFKVYAEGIKRGYLGGNTGLYVLRHEPFAMLSDVADNPTVANQVIWPFSQFAADVANKSLPEFSFIVPDLNDDAHNGTPLQADDWLQANIVGAPVRLLRFPTRCRRPSHRRLR